MVRTKHSTIIYWQGKKIKLDVPLEDFFATVLLFYGEPGCDFRAVPYTQRVPAFTTFKRLMDSTELGGKFMQCVEQCGGLKSQRWDLYHMYIDWHVKATKRVRDVERSIEL